MIILTGSEEDMDMIEEKYNVIIKRRENSWSWEPEQYIVGKIKNLTKEKQAEIMGDNVAKSWFYSI
jgi:hypothetical protein